VGIFRQPSHEAIGKKIVSKSKPPLSSWAVALIAICISPPHKARTMPITIYADNILLLKGKNFENGERGESRGTEKRLETTTAGSGKRRGFAGIY